MSTEFIQIQVVLASQDVVRDVAWYCDVLGFERRFDSGDEPLNYAGIAINGQEMHLQYQFPHDMWVSDLRIQVRNIQFIFDKLVGKGLVKSESMRRDTPWGTHEFGFFDPSGNRIHYYEDVI